MIALVDADSIVYRVICSIEDKVIWNQAEIEVDPTIEPDVSYTSNFKQCKETFDEFVEGILHYTGCDDIQLVFTGKNNFRYKNPLGYKQNRKNLRKPLNFKELMEYVFSKYPDSIMCEDYEADDYVVYLKTKQPDDYLLCAIDKDVLFQTEGTHYNFGTGEEIWVSPLEAIRFAYFQTLTGDVTDGYKGCPGIGKVRAEKILEQAETEYEEEGGNQEAIYWKHIVKTYESKGLTEEDAINTMRLANMHQLVEVGNIQLWEPTSDEKTL
jgi:DNA polymerase-1